MSIACLCPDAAAHRLEIQFPTEAKFLPSGHIAPSPSVSSFRWLPEHLLLASVQVVGRGWDAGSLIPGKHACSGTGTHLVRDISPV